MAERTMLMASLLLALLAAAAASAAGSGGIDVLLSWELGMGGDDDGEFGYGESSSALAVARRVLQSGGYLSYGALQRDSVPCSQRGASYYNCRPGAQANPYSRGCSAITRCRG